MHIVREAYAIQSWKEAQKNSLHSGHHAPTFTACSSWGCCPLSALDLSSFLGARGSSTGIRKQPRCQADSDILHSSTPEVAEHSASWEPREGVGRGTQALRHRSPRVQPSVHRSSQCSPEPSLPLLAYWCVCAAHTHSSGWQANLPSSFQRVTAEIVEHFSQELMLFSKMMSSVRWFRKNVSTQPGQVLLPGLQTGLCSA